eukprot:3913260-Pleurochrysis_carterae.AAC.1
MLHVASRLNPSRSTQSVRGLNQTSNGVLNGLLADGARASIGTRTALNARLVETSTRPNPERARATHVRPSPVSTQVPNHQSIPT